MYSDWLEARKCEMVLKIWSRWFWITAIDRLEMIAA